MCSQKRTNEVHLLCLKAFPSFLPYYLLTFCDNRSRQLPPAQPAASLPRRAPAQLQQVTNPAAANQHQSPQRSVFYAPNSVPAAITPPHTASVISHQPPPGSLPSPLPPSLPLSHQPGFQLATELTNSSYPLPAPNTPLAALNHKQSVHQYPPIGLVNVHANASTPFHPPQSPLQVK